MFNRMGRDAIDRDGDQAKKEGVGWKVKGVCLGRPGEVQAVKGHPGQCVRQAFRWLRKVLEWEIELGGLSRQRTWTAVGLCDVPSGQV